MLLGLHVEADVVCQEGLADAEAFVNDALRGLETCRLQLWSDNVLFDDLA